MTSREIDKEITATARQLTKTIEQHAQITIQLNHIATKITEHLENSNPKNSVGLGVLAGGAGTAAILTETTTTRIRYLSYQLRTLLDGEESENG